MKLSYVIVTHNRRAALLRTLGIVAERTSLPADQWELLVVDNGSTDGSAQAVAAAFPAAQVICRPTNEGVWARNYAINAARGEYLVLLDDDSYPVADAVACSLAYLDDHAGTAAVVGRVVLPDGGLEACALPAVMLSGAVCLRRSLVMQVGGFRREFFRKAGEYDLSFRLWQAGGAVERFEDVVYRHDKVAHGRSAALAHRMDLRNNLILVERYLPADLRAIYRDDWTQRYRALAEHAGCADAADEALAEAAQWAQHEEKRGREVLDCKVLETIFTLEAQARTIAAWAEHYRLRRVLVADLAKNVYATVRGCRQAGLQVEAVLDNNPAFAGLAYRGCPVVPDAAALGAEQRPPDGIVLANVNPAQVDRRLAELAEHFTGPILRLWRPRYLGNSAGARMSRAVAPAVMEVRPA